MCGRKTAAKYCDEGKYGSHAYCTATVITQCDEGKYQRLKATNNEECLIHHIELKKFK